MSRTARRKEFDPNVRLSLVEQDHDEADARMERLEAELKRIRNLLVGVLISVATGSVMIAIQTLTSSFGGGG